MWCFEPYYAFHVLFLNADVVILNFNTANAYRIKFYEIMGLNLEKALLHERQKEANEEQILRAYLDMLEQDNAKDAQIINNITQPTGGPLTPVNIDHIEASNIYTERQIRNICVRYRLRFLDAALFKGDIPFEAISKIKEVQNRDGIELKNFKIVAPAGLFRLKYKDKDPILFLDLGNGYYYKIHKWGKDLHPLRGLIMYPFRNFTTLFKTITGISFAAAALMPSSVMMGPYDTSSFPIRVVFFFYMFIALAGLTSLYGFSRMKNFSEKLWNSQYDD